ncbi:MAG: molecular chaperone DnaJ [Mycoplasma sp.]|nr:molecular chaperone DnaJ [Mycoplasma sp.]
MNIKRDYYEILNVPKNAEQSDIKRAFRKLAMKYHPDRNKEADAEDKFKEINQAYEILSDPEKRRSYDQFGHSAFEQGGMGSGGFNGFNGSDFSDIFGDIFGGAFGGREQRNSTNKGENYQTTVTIDFMSAILGKNISRTLPKYEVCKGCSGSGAHSKNDVSVCSSCQGSGSIMKALRTPFGLVNSTVTCDDCGGEGKRITKKCLECNGDKITINKKEIEIKIPAGINNGQNIIVQGFGGPGHNGGASGDLYLQANIIEHKYFTREGNNLFLDVPVSVIDIIKGNYIDIPTPYGTEQVKVSSKITSGTRLILNNRGVPSVSNGRKGDLIITINIYVPKTNTKETNELLKIFEKVKDKKSSKWLKEF